jgi:peptide/nickel transport system permease protein
MRRGSTRTAMGALMGLVLVALFADVLAADHPLLLRLDGELHLLPNLQRVPSLALKDNAWLRAWMTPNDWAVFPPHERGPASTVELGELTGPLPLGPGPGHPLGTDSAGRDVLARLIHGTRLSLSMGLFATMIAVFVGLLLGLWSGYRGGAVDAFVTRVTELTMNVPVLFLLLALQGLQTRPTLLSTVLVLGLTGWPTACRVVRAEARRVGGLDYVRAAQALGAGHGRIVWRHVLPNAVRPLFVTATFGVGHAILLEAGLSFLGFGVPEPAASWGRLMADGFQSVLRPEARWMILLPGLALFVTMLSLNTLGEALQASLEPKGRDR